MKEPTAKTPGKSKPVQLEMTSPWQKYANVVLIPVIIGLTVFLLVRFRMNANADAKAADSAALTDIRLQLSQIRQREMAPVTAIPAQYAEYRNATHAETEKRIDSLLDTTKDPVIRAEALVAKGDLNWIAANFPVLPGAATQPSLRSTKSPEEHLAIAEQAYNTVLKDYADQTTAAYSAQLGLGALAENRQKWDDAIAAYKTVADDKSAPAAFSSVASQRLEIIKMIREPVYLGQAATKPTTEPSTTMPVEPTTRPTTMSVAPTTMPSASH